jgi:hypothetical protein
VPDGDKRYIRKEYTEVSKLNEGDTPTPAPDPTPTQEEDNNDTEHEDQAQE